MAFGHVGIECCENRPQQRLALRIADEDRGLVTHAHAAEHRLYKRADRAGHTGSKTRILPQNGREQSRSSPRQTGNEMDCRLQMSL